MTSLWARIQPLLARVLQPVRYPEICEIGVPDQAPQTLRNTHEDLHTIDRAEQRAAGAHPATPVRAAGSTGARTRRDLPNERPRLGVDHPRRRARNPRAAGAC